MSESERGCGYRKIGGLYLVSDAGFHLACDGLPLRLEACECCGFIPQLSRNLQRLNPEYIAHTEAKNPKHIVIDKFEKYESPRYNCQCPPSCPICHSNNFLFESFGLMQVGKGYYTPESFIKEAISMGVSKRIPEIPSWLKLGETWILLAHREVTEGITLEELSYNGLKSHDGKKIGQIFYAFKPQRIEMPVWKDEISLEEIQILNKRGITVIELDPTPENKKRHKNANNANVIRRLLQPIEENEEPEE